MTVSSKDMGDIHKLIDMIRDVPHGLSADASYHFHIASIYRLQETEKAEISE